MRGQGAEVDGLGVCFEGVEDAVREGGRQVERYERRGAEPLADGQHFAQPERERDARALFHLRAVVLE